jgi:hypothetical protein
MVKYFESQWLFKISRVSLDVPMGTVLLLIKILWVIFELADFPMELITDLKARRSVFWPMGEL